VIIHRLTSEKDKKRVFDLLNWSNAIGQQMREFRYLGELSRGHCLIRMDAKNHFLESAPVAILTEPASLGHVTDDRLAEWAAMR
jgi:hypothetical protein